MFFHKEDIEGKKRKKTPPPFIWYCFQGIKIKVFALFWKTVYKEGTRAAEKLRTTRHTTRRITPTNGKQSKRMPRHYSHRGPVGANVQHIRNTKRALYTRVRVTCF